MDGSPFDALARVLAGSASRRTVLRRLGEVSAAAALLAAKGAEVRAQGATPPAATPAVTGPVSAVSADGRCLLLFEATVRQGPSAGKSLTGILALAVDSSGAVSGDLLRPHGGRNPVVGQATGRAINLLIDLGGGQTLYGVGTADSAIGLCRISDLGGPLVGPVAGDAGDWAILQTTHCIGPQGQPTQCPSGLGQPLPTGGGGGTVLDGDLSGPCNEIALTNCTYVCTASHLSTDCATYCAQALFCPS